MNWKIDGFTEVGLGVNDPGPWIDLLKASGQWDVLHEGFCDTPILTNWGVATSVPEVLIGPTEHPAGALRLFEFGPAVGAARSESSTWDTGGVFDIDIRVRDLHACHRAMTDQGWTGVSEPVDWDFGDIRTREWLACGPDSTVIAFIERLSPPLDQLPRPGFSHVFNSSQTVRDMQSTMAFYELLGFRQVIHQKGPLAGKGGEVLGLTEEEAPNTLVDLAILSPSGIIEGAVELVALPDKPGRDLSHQAGPLIRGFNLLRFPVSGIEAFSDHLAHNGIPLAGGILDTRINPHGPVRWLAVRSPDGVWLEFYEVIS